MAIHVTLHGVENIEPENGEFFTLEELQKLVGGYVQPVYLKDGRVMYVDEDGAPRGLARNDIASDLAGYGVVGNTVVLTTAENDSFNEMSDDDDLEDDFEEDDFDEDDPDFEDDDEDFDDDLDGDGEDLDDPDDDTDYSDEEIEEDERETEGGD